MFDDGSGVDSGYGYKGDPKRSTEKMYKPEQPFPSPMWDTLRYLAVRIIRSEYAIGAIACVVILLLVWWAPWQ